MGIGGPCTSHCVPHSLCLQGRYMKEFTIYFIKWMRGSSDLPKEGERVSILIQNPVVHRQWLRDSKISTTPRRLHWESIYCSPRGNIQKSRKISQWNLEHPVKHQSIIFREVSLCFRKFEISIPRNVASSTLLLKERRREGSSFGLSQVLREIINKRRALEESLRRKFQSRKWVW